MVKFKFSGICIDNGEIVTGNLIQISDKHAYIVGYFEKGEYLPDEDLWNCKCVVHKVNMKTVNILEVRE